MSLFIEFASAVGQYSVDISDEYLLLSLVFKVSFYTVISMVMLNIMNFYGCNGKVYDISLAFFVILTFVSFGFCWFVDWPVFADYLINLNDGLKSRMIY